MARLVEVEAQRLRAEVTMVGLAAARGVELTERDGVLVGRCPFHADEGASLVIDPGANTWRCVGRCADSGSVVEWVMRAEGVSRAHATELLRSGTPPTGSGPPPKVGTVRRLGGRVEVGLSDEELLSHVVSFYAETLATAPDAQGWLSAHGLADAELLSRFRVGFANRTLGYRLPAKNRRAGAALRGRLTEVGILRPTGHEQFRGALTVPLFDANGALTHLYGHRIGRARSERNPNSTADVWLSGERAGLWNPEAVASSEVVLAGGVIDAMSAWAAGLRHVLAAGPGGFGPAEVAFLASSGVGRVLIAFPRPDGDAAAEATARAALAAGIEAFRVSLPRYASLNELTGADVAKAPETLARLVRNAVWMGSGPPPRPARARDDAPPRPPSPPSSPPSTPLRSPPTPTPRRGALPPNAVSTSPPATSAPPTSSPAHALIEPATVSPLPAGPAAPDVIFVGGELRLGLGDRRWRLRGLEAATSFDSLRLNVAVARVDSGLGELFHVESLDLYSARSRAGFVSAAAGELRVGVEVLRRDLAVVIREAEVHAAEAVRSAQSPQDKLPAMTAQERAAALDLLGAPDLIARIVADVARIGVVGEETNALVVYLAGISRKLERPLSVIVQSASGAGKSSLIEAVLSLVPPEERVSYSAVTGQALYYLGSSDLAHRCLLVSEEEGASRASYALKLLLSEGALSIASTNKDASGRLRTQTYRVSGPVAAFMTTTAAVLDEELANRAVVVGVDEERDQTRAIHAAQRRAATLEGLLSRTDAERVRRLHHNAQRLLEPVSVVNPYAPRLAYTDAATRTRRDHAKYLNLISAIALLHQHQRPIHRVMHEDVEIAYVEVVRADIALANRLAHEVLGRSLDELAPATRRVLRLAETFVTERAGVLGVTRADVRFTRRQLREASAASESALRVHLGRLVDLEYLITHRGGRGQSFIYELAWDGGGADGAAHLDGLIDASSLGSCDYDTDLAGPEDDFVGASSAGRTPFVAAAHCDDELDCAEVSA